MPDRIVMTEPTIVPVTHSCGHRVEYPWDAWEVTLNRHPDREPCAVCRRKEHHKITGKPYSIAINPLTQEVTLWHDGWPFPLKADVWRGLIRELAEACDRAEAAANHTNDVAPMPDWPAPSPEWGDGWREVPDWVRIDPVPERIDTLTPAAGDEGNVSSTRKELEK